uniref:Taste receptor type 2 n=1 Tax=Cyanistes caeruleus TaxID=156563 RepID=A0A8C0UQU3_CYACU
MPTKPISRYLNTSDKDKVITLRPWVSMMTSFALFFQAISIIESMAGLLGTGIILAAILLSCIKSKTRSPYDTIVISLSSSRFIFHSWNILDSFLNIWHEQYYIEETRGVVSNAVWFGAWLSVFYCIKVATFTHSFFIWLKQRIARLMPWMLLTSWLCSFIAAIPFIWDDYALQRNFTNHMELSVVSSVLLIRSLWIHRRRMQNNASGFRDPSSEAHISAIKSVCSFLIIFIIYFICLLLLLCSDFLPFSDEESICAAVLSACPTGHTLILIWSNPKFREQLARIWHHINCHGRTAST